jgi:transcriptional regulator with XRE-family HTH domain
MMGTQEQGVTSRMGIPMARYRIKDVAQERNISLRAIAVRGRLSETRVRDVANNRVDNVTVRFLEAIAAGIGCPFGEIFEPSTLAEVPSFPTADVEELKKG